MNSLDKFNEEPAAGTPSVTTPAAPVWAPFEATDADFNTSAQKYNKELLFRPVRRIFDVLKDIVTIRPGIRYAEKQYSIDADTELGNYDPYRTQEVDPEIGARTLYTYLGSTPILKFDPNKFYRTFLGSDIMQGEGLTNTEITRLMLNVLAGKLGDKLLKVIFSASRTENGTTSATLFNGYDTITATEIANGGIAADKGNYFEFDEAISVNNAVEQIKAFVASADDYLLENDQVNLLMTPEIYRAYLEDYKATTGAIPYNTSYKQTSVEGFDNVIMRPLASKRGTSYLQLTTKANTLVGVNQMGDPDERLIVEKHHPVFLDFFATMFFGVDWKSINSEYLHVGKLHS